MFLILYIVLIFTIPTPPYFIQFDWEASHSEGGFLRKLQDKQDKYQWRAAIYRDITIGKSTSMELRKKWGKSKRSGHYEWDNRKNPKFLFYVYDAPEGLTGDIRVEVETKTGKVTSIVISSYELTLSQALELFGKDYIETRYKSCTCDPDNEAPFFESPDGNRIYIEYRSRGIAMFVGSPGQITFIRFVDKPIGFTSSKECEKRPECRPKK